MAVATALVPTAGGPGATAAEEEPISVLQHFLLHLGSALWDQVPLLENTLDILLVSFSLSVSFPKRFQVKYGDHPGL